MAFDISKYMDQLTSALSFDMSSAGSDVKKTSVFNAGYIPTSDADDSSANPKGKVYFKTGNSEFWEMIVTKFTESHAEKYALHNPMSDAIVMHAAGAAPVRITIEAYLPVGADMDARARFLRRYIQEFNERKHQQQGTKLTCCVRNTVFRLLIENIVLIDSVDTADYTTLSVSGLASEYAVGGATSGDGDLDFGSVLSDIGSSVAGAIGGGLAGLGSYAIGSVTSGVTDAVTGYVSDLAAPYLDVAKSAQDIVASVTSDPMKAVDSAVSSATDTLKSAGIAIKKAL